MAAESSESLPIDISAGQDQMRRVANALSARAIDIDGEGNLRSIYCTLCAE